MSLKEKDEIFKVVIAEKNARIIEKNARIIEKDERFKFAIAEKNARINEKDERLKEKDAMLIEKNNEIELNRAKYEGTSNIRPILEHSLRSKYSLNSASNFSVTQMFEKEVTSMFELNSSKLTPEWKNKLYLLEASANPSSIALELKSLFHLLSKKHHYPALQESGMVIGGEFPMRAAIALFTLHLQKQKLLSDKISFKYADEKYTVKADLLNGEIYIRE